MKIVEIGILISAPMNCSLNITMLKEADITTAKSNGQLKTKNTVEIALRSVFK